MGLKLNRVYEHYKGKRYRVLNIVKHSESLEDLVLYECLYENDLGKHWVRPLQMFLEEVVVDGVKRSRFKLLD
ncbi:MAG: DUF1653 domain-containing protein [Bdellovibrionales bacterium]